jgi:L-serine dehydratase
MISLFEIFKIGIGPSSSHTVVPLAAARQFVCRLRAEEEIGEVARACIELYGSPAFTGKGRRAAG